MDWKDDMDEQSEWTGGSGSSKMVWKLLVRPSMEYAAAEVWWTGGQYMQEVGVVRDESGH